MKTVQKLFMIVCSAVANPLGRIRLACQMIDTSAGVPDEVLLVPWGHVESSSGNFLVDEDAADSMLRAFKTHAVDLPIDFEHQTLGGENASPDGKAPAAGWIKILKAVPNRGIVGTVEWTQDGSHVVSARTYRYISPVVMCSKVDRRALELHSIGLTNKPAIRGMRPIVNSEGQAQAAGDVDSTLQELDGMMKDAGMESSPFMQSSSFVGLVRKLVDQVRALCQSMAASTTNETMAHRESREEVKRLRLANREASMELLLQKNSGKVSPSKGKWFRDWFLMDPEAARQWLEGAPKLVYTEDDAPGGTSCKAMPNPDRRAVIVAARSAYRQEVATLKNAGHYSSAMICSERAYVNLAMRDGGHARLTDDEEKTFQIVC